MFLPNNMCDGLECDVIMWICRQQIADYFEDLAADNMIRQREEKWEEYADYFDSLAFAEVDRVANDHLAFVMLTAPLTDGTNEPKNVCKFDDGGL